MKLNIKLGLRYLLKAVISVAFLFFILISIVFITNSLKTPSLDREWSEDSAILPEIEILPGESTDLNDAQIVSVKNIRDWRYDREDSAEPILSKNYYNDEFDLAKIEKTYLLFNPFGKWNGIGHSFFLFEFSDGKTVSVSVEARRELGEGFNSLKGFFNVYELWYAFGSSADFLTRRAVHYTDNELNMYPLSISPDISRDLFLDLAKQAQKLQTEAQFYNTFTSNCTNLLMNSANRVKPDSVPFHYSRLFTGFADDYIYKLGFIENSELSENFEEVNKKYRVDEKIKEIDKDLENYSTDEFWQILKKQFDLID